MAEVNQRDRLRWYVPEVPEVQPARTDGFVAAMSQRAGGPLGRYADLVRRWWSPPRIILAVATLTYLVGMVFRLPCRISTLR